MNLHTHNSYCKSLIKDILANHGWYVKLLEKIHLKGVQKMKKQKNSTEQPIIAEGMNTEDELQQDASSEEISKGEYTNVTTLSLDENDPS